MKDYFYFSQRDIYFDVYNYNKTFNNCLSWIISLRYFLKTRYICISPLEKRNQSSLNDHLYTCRIASRKNAETSLISRAILTEL